MPNPPRTPPPAAQPGDPLDLSESVAGEEDPGASIDVASVPATGVAPMTPRPDDDTGPSAAERERTR